MKNTSQNRTLPIRPIVIWAALLFSLSSFSLLHGQESRANLEGHVTDQQGAIVPGADADLIVVDLKRRAKITKDLLHTVTPWSVYEGWDVSGWPVMTLVRGHIVMEWPEGEPRATVTDASVGQYLRRHLQSGV